MGRPGINVVLRFGDPADVLASIPAMLPQLLIPTLIFQSSRDKAIPAGFAKRASTLIPRSKIVTVDSGHFIPLNNPEVVAAELLNFCGPNVRRCDGCLASSCARIALLGPNFHGDQDGSGHKSCDQRHDHHHGEQRR